MYYIRYIIKRIHFVLFLIICMYLYGCKDTQFGDIDNQVSLIEKSHSEIPVDVAIDRLMTFLAENEGTMPTKSETPREIESIDVHYRELDSLSQGDSIIDCYIVNFCNDEGFAILGAVEDIPGIVAVAEDGHLDPVSLCVEADTTGSNIVPTDIPYYSEEDDDYFFVTNPNIINFFIEEGVRPKDSYITRPGPGGESTGGGLPATTEPGARYAECSPMTPMWWNQGDWNNIVIFNKYCYKTFFEHRTYVFSGCSTTALALIIATNEFPSPYVVNGTTLDYDVMKQDSTVYSSPSPEMLEHIALLYGSIFQTVDRVFAWSAGTCILPEAIKQRMSALGYISVQMLKDSYFNEDMLVATSAMMHRRMPLFVSAVSGLLDGHSWVVDGAKYDSEGNYLLHCNWGWSGSFNGYYSPACFNPRDLSFSWHYRLISYDIPSESYPVNVMFD